MANGSVLDYVKHHKEELLHTSEATEAQGTSCIPCPHRKKGFVTLTNILITSDAVCKGDVVLTKNIFPMQPHCCPSAKEVASVPRPCIVQYPVCGLPCGFQSSQYVVQHPIYSLPISLENCTFIPDAV